MSPPRESDLWFSWFIICSNLSMVVLEILLHFKYIFFHASIQQRFIKPLPKILCEIKWVMNNSRNKMEIKSMNMGTHTCTHTCRYLVLGIQRWIKYSPCPQRAYSVVRRVNNPVNFLCAIKCSDRGGWRKYHPQHTFFSKELFIMVLFCLPMASLGLSVYIHNMGLTSPSWYRLTWD